MGKVYLVRHGQTDWTSAGRVQGWSPVPLNDSGQNQMRLTGEYLSEQIPKSEKVQIETSDLRRAEESAKIIRGNLACNAELNRRTEIRERNFGVFQGLDDSQYHRLKRQQETNEALFWSPEEGESWREVETRVLRFWIDCVQSTSDERIRIVVAHMGPIYSILAGVTDQRFEKVMEKMDLEEGSVFEIKLTEFMTDLVSDWHPESN